MAANREAMVYVEVPGLPRLYAELKIAQRDVQLKLNERIAAAPELIKARIKANAAGVSTKKGMGLTKAQSAIRISHHSSPRVASARISMDRHVAPYVADGDTFRHPIYAPRGVKITQMPANKIVDQPTQHKFFDDAVIGAEIYMEVEIVKVLDEIIGMLAHG